MKIAVSKYGEVAQTLDFAREFSKQILQIATLSEKDLKKKLKKVNIIETYYFYIHIVINVFTNYCIKGRSS